VCPSPAIDVTYDVLAFAPGSHRVRRVTHRPGGKAVNVATVRTTIGEPALVLAPVGGETGAEFRTGLSTLGITTEVVRSRLPTHRTVRVVDASNGEATLLSEPSRVDCWDAVADRFTALLPGADAAVLQTVPVALALSQGELFSNVPGLMAAAAIIIVPVFLVGLAVGVDSARDRAGRRGHPGHRCTSSACTGQVSTPRPGRRTRQ
jgi:sugar/nucleoside kinase (ribokinase family)